ncbi:hypothetical protein J4E93_000998 [Alternaria ventricosa]|uniref:uncharacterized protein n=1 Tax=Alternaria ventricosa TaxID=1187951 RepID=UPI0020C32529|nr:uncharacterized protein J4E93_000998 [Alternaria ventricosa]KAI4656279.1 hypothetical protein J4E93_000998 [Alternaria ventricosa]
MAGVFLKILLFTTLRAARAPTGARPVPRYQPETEYEASNEVEEEDATTKAHEDSEDEFDDDVEPVPAAEDAGDNADPLRTSSSDHDLRATWTASINNLWRRAADNATILAAQARDAAFDAVEMVKELGFIGTAKAIGHWIRLNPLKTALIVVPLVALACTAIALSATGFGPAGIVADLATSESASLIAKQAASDAVFWSMVAVAYAVYQFKSWYQGRGEGAEEEEE